MQEIISIIIEQASIWMPSIVAIAGIVVSVITALGKIGAALGETKEAVAKLKDDTTIKELRAEVREQVQQSKQLQEYVKLLTDKVAKIEGYSDNILKKGD